MQNLKNSVLHNFLFCAFLVLAVYFCYIGGYGSDEDTLPMLGTFKNFLDGNFMTSRFTGYPVAEFSIGFLSYFYGSFITNLFTFLLFIIGSTIFYLSNTEKLNRINWSQLMLYLILLISNPVLFFDNLEPIDYSWAFFFFAIGCYSLSKQQKELACIFFGICIGTRINFCPFVIAAIFTLPMDQKLNLSKKIVISLSSIFIGCLFYLPVWIHSSLTLEWLTAGRPEDGLMALIARFSYKTFLTIGYLQVFLITYLAYKFCDFKIVKKNLNFMIAIIILNLAIFLWIPAELSYLQPMLICLYFIITKSLNRKFIYLILIFNLSTWIYNFNPIKIDYKYKDKCAPRVATSIKISPHFDTGYLKRFIENKKMINCWIDPESKYGKIILEGKPLKELDVN